MTEMTDDEMIDQLQKEWEASQSEEQRERRDNQALRNKMYERQPYDCEHEWEIDGDMQYCPKCDTFRSARVICPECKREYQKLEHVPGLFTGCHGCYDQWTKMVSHALVIQKHFLAMTSEALKAAAEAKYA